MRTSMAKVCILNDLRVELEGPMKLYCYNKSAINIAHNPIQQQHERTNMKLIDTLSRNNRKKAWFVQLMLHPDSK